MKAMVFDIETTGFDEPVDIVQLCYLIFDLETGEVTEPGTVKYFLPERNHINADAYSVTGISEELLYTYTNEGFSSYIDNFTQKIQQVNVLMGYNLTSFDLRILRGYNNQNLTDTINSKTIIDVMKDFMETYNKVICAKKSSSWVRSYLKLIECYYLLLRNGFNKQELQKEYQKIFSNTADSFHNAAFDTFITYIAYKYAVKKREENAGKIH